jgi:hypothetical protein
MSYIEVSHQGNYRQLFVVHTKYFSYANIEGTYYKIEHSSDGWKTTTVLPAHQIPKQ